MDWTRDGDERRWLAAPFSLKGGIGTDSDRRLVLAPYASVREQGRVVASGISDLAIRLKHILRGNDGGRTALAIMPWVSLPTGSSGRSFEKLQGGVILPLAIETASSPGVGVMAQVDLLWNSAAARHGTALLHSAVIGADLSERGGEYLECVGIVFWDLDAGFLALLDAGRACGLSSRSQLDVGARVGVSDEVGNLGLFLGYAVRLPRSPARTGPRGSGRRRSAAPVVTRNE